MSEDERPTDPVTRVGRDLDAIIDLYAKLTEQAVRDASHWMMPGGAAMVALGNVANMEAWENQQQATERHERRVEGYDRAYTSVEDEDPDEAWSAFQLLEFWSEDWRRIHGAEYGKRPTIASEANFIHYLLEWAWDNEPQWDDFARDVNQARLKLEDILTAGRRVERTRVLCSNPACPSPRRLIRLVGNQGREDVWKCPGCKTRFDEDGFKRATARQMHHENGQRYVPLSDAISTLVSQGRGERTVRRWMAPIEGEMEEVIEGYCDITTRRTWVFWPDLWRKHLATRKTPRASA